MSLCIGKCSVYVFLWTKNKTLIEDPTSLFNFRLRAQNAYFIIKIRAMVDTENTETPNTAMPQMHVSNMSFERLQGVDNYQTWKFAMRMALVLENLWDCVIATSEQTVDTARDGRALARICLGIKPCCYQYVRDINTSKKAWDTLSSIFEDKGLYRRVLLLRQLHKTELSQFASMSQYIESVMGLVHQLADIGKVIDDQEVSELLLSGLGQEYDALVSSLETASMTKDLCSELVRSRLMQEEARKKTSTDGSTSAAFVSKKVQRSNITCTFCKRVGHVASKCFKLKKLKKKEKENEQTSYASAFLAAQDQQWIVDSGASNHMCRDRSLYKNLKDYNNKITIANNTTLPCKGVGDVSLDCSVRNLNNVLYIPGISVNLLSVSKLVQQGLTITFNRDGCYFFKSCKVEGQPIATASNYRGIYRLNVGVGEKSSHEEHSTLMCSRHEPESVTDAARSNMSANLWHKRLGHLNVNDMNVLKNGASTGVSFQLNTNQLQDCIACLEGKMSAKSYPVGEAKRATQPLELIHSDVCGPMPEASWGGAKYFVTFTDDYTRRSFVYLIRNKNEVMSCFIYFKKLVEKQLGLSIKVLRSDNGGEYTGAKFEEYLKSSGIIHQTSVPYCAQQNGVSERLNRTLVEKARCMLQEAGLCGRYWGEAVMTAAYLKNRCPTSALAGLTPMEKWTGSIPDLSHLHVFGCLAYSLVPGQHRRKFDVKSKPYVFVGYSETSKGFRLMDPHKPGKVLISRNVAFIENKFYTKDININLENNDFIYYDYEYNCNKICDTKFNNESNNNVINSVGNLQESSQQLEPIPNVQCEPNSSPCNELNIHDNSSHTIGPNSSHNSIQNSNDSYMSTGIADEEYCTGSEEESNSVWSPPDDGSRSERLSSSGGTPLRGEASSSAPPPAVVRPVRSTRSKLPSRYDDYEVDCSLVTQDVTLDEPLTYEEAISGPNSEHWQSAMQSEYNSLIANNVWQLVNRPLNQNIVKCKWVFKTKFDADGKFSKFKARLVARGFTQVEGLDYNETFSPVVRHSTMRILFSLANEMNLDINHVDVTTAFLHGDLSETIYMEQPPGFDNGNKSKVCLLKRGIYGLKQASRIWNSKVHSLLSKHGYKQSKCEPCVYTNNCNDDLCIIALYVDDFYIFSSHNSCLRSTLLKLLQSNFDVKNLGDLKSCLGIRVTRDRVRNTLSLDQSEYIKKLLIKFGMDKCKPVSTPMPVNLKLYKCEGDHLCDEKYHYRQLLGCLMYLSVCTRPDISYACSMLSQFNNSFGKEHWLAAKRILRYLASTINYSLLYVKSSKLFLNAYADADWANDPLDRKSYTGFVIKLGNNVVHWESRKQRCIALSSTEAEYLAIGDVCKDISFTKNLLSEILCKHNIDVIVYNDNQSAQKLLKLKEYCHKRTKHIDLRYHYVKELVKDNVISVEYMPTEKMIADVLTKPLSSIKHAQFLNSMNVCNA